MRAITKTCLAAWARHLEENEKGRGKNFLEIMGKIMEEEYMRGVKAATNLIIQEQAHLTAAMAQTEFLRKTKR